LKVESRGPSNERPKKQETLVSKKEFSYGGYSSTGKIHPMVKFISNFSEKFTSKDKKYLQGVNKFSIKLLYKQLYGYITDKA
jgi:hypothetical protein